MAPDANPDDDEAALAGFAAALADAVEAALPGWVERVVAERTTAQLGSVPDEVRAEAAAAGRAVAADLGPPLRALLALDIDEQWTNPLAIVRRAAPAVSAVLRSAGVAPPTRDEVARRLHPDDVDDVGPAAFADLGPEVGDLGIAWGAAKAHVHLQRRRREGRR